MAEARPAGVPRETPAGLATRYGLPADAAERFERLVEALSVEPDPPTTVREPADVLRRHVADSLSGLEVEALARAGTMADLGAGAGFPGLALAAALPHARVDLVEASARKCAVIERLAAAAGVDNARAIRARAEEWAADAGAGAYDAVTARAVAPLPVLVEYAAPLLRMDGTLVAWKGARAADEERAGAAAGAEVGLEPSGVLEVVPFAGAHSRHLHVFVKTGPTPPGVPRRAGAALRRPFGRS